MDLSIIIPIYNAEKYLKKCLERILDNQNQNIEIILINDGSKDNSDKICKKFNELDKRIKYKSIENNGCSNARNLGINLSTGKYIWFIDSDDFIEKNAINEILEEIKKDPEIIIFGTKLKDIKNKREEVIIPKMESKRNFIFNQTFLFNSPWNKIYQREIIVDNKINFLLNCHMGEDMIFNFKYFYYIERITFINKAFYNYCLESGVTSSPKKRLEIFKAFDEIFEFYKNKNFQEIKKTLKKYYKINAIKYTYKTVMQSTLSKVEKKIQIKEIKKEIRKRKYIFNSEFLFLQLFWIVINNFLNFSPRLLNIYFFIKDRRIKWKK